MQKLVGTFNELLTRSLSLMRLMVPVGMVCLQSMYIHSVDLSVWLARLAALGGLTVLVAFALVPEQLYNGLALRHLRWVFEMVYPEAVHWNGSAADSAENGPTALGCSRSPADLGGARARLRWHGSNRYLCLTEQGWGVPGDECFATTFFLEQVVDREKKVPDTYTFRVQAETSEWHHAWLSFQALNHLRFGGWLGAYRDASKACPYKIVRDTSCPQGACKLLCGWDQLPPPSQHFCTGFYLSEQLYGSKTFVGHAPDRNAALFEMVLV